MRVLLATDVFAPSTGGTERHVAGLAERLDDAVVVTTTPGPAVDGVVRLTGWSGRLIRHHARPEQRFHPPVPDPGLVRELVALCRAERIDVVHAHGWMAHSAVPAARRAGVPVVVSLHDYGLDCAVRNRLRDGEPCPGPSLRRCGPCAAARYGAGRGLAIVAGLAASRRWWDGVDAFVANSRAVAAAVDVPCTVVSPWMVPAEPEAPPVPDLPDEFVLYVGALAPHKGIAVLAEAWDGPLVGLVSRPEAGSPELPPGTLLHHDVDHVRVLATMRRATVTVVPSTYPEPFGLVAVEAMWAGSPVIASDTAGLREVLAGGSAGSLVPPGDPAALRAAIDRLWSDAARRRDLAFAGRRRAAELDGLPALLAVYEKVQAQASARSLRT